MIGIALLFSAPMLAYGLVETVMGTRAEGSIFSLFFGLGMGWLMFEFVARREVIVVDRAAGELRYTSRGVFRTIRRAMRLTQIQGLTIERRTYRGRTRQSVFVTGRGYERVLINDPSVLYIDHSATAEIIRESLGVPLHTIDL